jgi:hypothetical protein
MRRQQQQLEICSFRSGANTRVMLSPSDLCALSCNAPQILVERF